MALRRRVKASRKRGSAWVRLFDLLRLALTSNGRAQLWTQLVHRKEIQQTTGYTAEERYPELFDFVAKAAPDARRILSFGCSTGEELFAVRRRFATAEIVGVEINARSRRIASRRMNDDGRTKVVAPSDVQGTFDLVFALAVLQREPVKVFETDLRDISRHYPFSRFDSAVSKLTRSIRPGGLLCVMHSHYRVEDSSAARDLVAVGDGPRLDGVFFRPDGQRLDDATSAAIFRRLLESDG